MKKIANSCLLLITGFIPVGTPQRASSIQRIATEPLFPDPVYDGAAGPVVVNGTTNGRHL